MNGINRVSAVSIITLANDLISMGVPQVQIEKSLGRKLTSFDDEEARIPLDILVSIENAAPHWTGDIAVGFALGMMGDVDSSKTGVVGYIARHSPTLVIAISQAIRYANLISDGIQMDLQTKDNTANFIYSRPFPNTYSIIGAEIAMVRMAGAIQTVVGEKARMLGANFEHAQPTYIDKYHHTFGENVRFEQEQCALIFPVDYLDTPIPGAQSYLHEVLEQQAKKQLKALDKLDGLSHQVRRMILNRLSTGEANIEAVARDLHISRQTLYRQLKTESTSFQKILDDTRKLLAANYLTEDRLIPLEIAFLLGFSESSAFYRAFKRWYGLTPNEYLKKD